MQHWWSLGHKERWPLPEEKVVTDRKAQVRVVFEARNLRLDSSEPTLKLREVSPFTLCLFQLPALHAAPHVRSHAIVPSRGGAWHLAGDDVAPPDFCFVG
jgi:hypothetical protein